MQEPRAAGLVSSAEAEALRREFPGWSFFSSAGVWYAAGLWGGGGSRHSRTLHATDADGLREQLATASGRERSEIGGQE